MVKLVIAAAVLLLLIGSASLATAQNEIDILARLLQTPESTLALVALVLGVISITVFVRASAKSTHEADRITNRILDQYEKLAAAQQQNAASQSNIAASIYELVNAIKKEFTSVRVVQAEQVKTARGLQDAVSENTHALKAYQTALDDTVSKLRESVLNLIARLGALEARVEEAAARAAEEPDKHARAVELLERIARDLEQQRALLIEYLNTPASGGENENRVQRERTKRTKQSAPARTPASNSSSVDISDEQPSAGPGD